MLLNRHVPSKFSETDSGALVTDVFQTQSNGCKRNQLCRVKQGYTSSNVHFLGCELTKLCFPPLILTVAQHVGIYVPSSIV